jgi:hypothetical protein
MKLINANYPKEVTRKWRLPENKGYVKGFAGFKRPVFLIFKSN